MVLEYVIDAHGSESEIEEQTSCDYLKVNTMSSRADFLHHLNPMLSYPQGHMQTFIRVWTQISVHMTPPMNCDCHRIKPSTGWHQHTNHIRHFLGGLFGSSKSLGPTFLNSFGCRGRFWGKASGIFSA